MRNFLFAAALLLSTFAYGASSDHYVFKNLDLEGLNPHLSGLPFINSSDLNQLIFVAPEPYICGFKINLFQDVKTGRIGLNFDEQTGMQEHVTWWQEEFLHLFATWDQR